MALINKRTMYRVSKVLVLYCRTMHTPISQFMSVDIITGRLGVNGGKRSLEARHQESTKHARVVFL